MREVLRAVQHEQGAVQYEQAASGWATRRAAGLARGLITWIGLAERAWMIIKRMAAQVYPMRENAVAVGAHAAELQRGREGVGHRG